MKREILFRGKRVDNGEWVYGDLFRSNKDHHTPNVCIVTDEFHPLGYGSNTFYEVLPETVGQFTGLTDKNGVKIFEGDNIVVDKTHQPFGSESEFEVIFGGSAKFHAAPSLYENLVECIQDTSGKNCCIVIGNIHDK
jgi:uncharacterized phage protein (TIGR01671 family)